MKKRLYSLVMFLCVFANAILAQTKAAPTPPATTSATKPKEAPKPPPPDNMKLTIGLDGDYRTGNISKSLIKGRLSLDYESPNSIIGFNTNPRYAYGTFRGALNENELFLDWNTTFYAYQKRLYYLVFGIMEKSNLRKITSRFLGGAGAGYRILGDKNNPKSRFKLSVTDAIIYEQTDYYTKADVNVIRNSARIKFSGEIIPKTLFLNNNTFIQPALNKPNLRWSTISVLSVKISNRFSLSSIIDYSYESVVPDGTKNADTVVSFGITFNDDIPLRSRPKRPYDWWMR